MAQVEDRSTGRRHPERFGLSAATLQAAIEADLEQSGSEGTAAIASAVARAIEANNEELLRQLNEMLSADRSSIDRG